ncbi:MAG: DUF4469 domain-containing protein [Bacteroidales bacterium]|jgi:hypothetical protein|nr:DUF4469 domain-containing protein [Bacteroidales bacterium]
MATHFWKVWLRPNSLTQDVGNDYIAEVSTTGNTLRNEQIAQRIVQGRSELRLETIVSILAQRDEIVREALQQGSSVQDGNTRISPRVSGNWIGSEARYNPAAHKITCDMTLTAEMRTALGAVGVEVLGVKESGAYIGLVTDIATDKTDGIVTPNEDIIIEGDKIKIAPDGEPGLGVFFVDAGGAEMPVTHRLAENNPKKLIVRVPMLAPGMYTLMVKTRFSNSSTLLKEIRTIVYSQPLTVTT